MKLRKSKVSMAVAATLGLACLAPSASFGSQEKYSVDTINQPVVGAAGVLSTDGRGDTLLFPLYTVANSAVTNFSVTNTSTQQVVAAKIRFREQVHSMDVLDMYVFLSPKDKFDFWVADDGPHGRPMVHWNDNSCVVGPMDVGARSVEFPPAWQPFVETDAQMRVGHMELLGVVDLSRTLLGPYAIHVNGSPRDCSVIARVFKDPAKISKLNNNENIQGGGWINEELVDGGYGKLYSVRDVLMGRYIITIPDKGMEAGGDAIAIRDTDLADPNNTGVNRAWRWHVTAHSVALCNNLNPSNCRSSDLYAWDQSEWSHPHLGEMYNLAGFQRALGAKAVAGDWSNNQDNHVNVDWVLSFPSKYAYLNYVNGNWVLLAHPKSQGWWLDEDYSESDGVWTSADTTNLTLRSVISVYGIEENGTGGVSPGDPMFDIPNETNVFTLLNNALGREPLDSIIQVNGNDELSRFIVGFTLPNTNRGWAKMNLTWASGRGIISNYIDDTTCNTTSLPSGTYVDLNHDNICDDLYQYVDENGNNTENGPDVIDCTLSAGLCRPLSDAVTGVIFTTRATSDPNQNDATLTELQKFSPYRGLRDLNNP